MLTDEKPVGEPTPNDWEAPSSEAPKCREVEPSLQEAESPRKWVFVSNFQSIEQGRFSMLALLETLVLSGCFLWVANRVGASVLLVTVCLSPLVLLLRTDASTELALEWWDRFAALVWDDDKEFASFSVVASNSLKLVVLSSTFMFRVFATALVVYRERGTPIAEIPRNWYSFAFCSDLATPQQLLPGAHRSDWEILLPGVHARTLMGRLRRLLRTESDDWFAQLLLIVIVVPAAGTARLVTLLPLLTIMWVPAAVHRAIVKGTAIVYLPLLWIIYSDRSSSFREKLSDIRTPLIGKIATLFGAVALAALLARWLAPPLWADLGAWLHVKAPVVAHVLQPEARAMATIPKWQVASGVNGLFAIGLYLAADYLAHLDANKRAIKEGLWSTVLRTVWPIRIVLSIYSIAVTLYSTASFVGELGLPPIGGDWFPF